MGTYLSQTDTTAETKPKPQIPKRDSVGYLRLLEKVKIYNLRGLTRKNSEEFILIEEADL